VVTPKSVTRAQKLAAALKACHKKKNKGKRASCERQAHKSYAAKASVKARAKGSRRAGRASGGRGGK